MTLPSRRVVSPSDRTVSWRLRPPAPPVVGTTVPDDPPVALVDEPAYLAEESVRVVLAVGDPDRRWVLRRAFERTGRLEVLAEVGDGSACLDAVREHGPDAVVVELDLVADDDLYVLRLAEGTPMSTSVVALDGLSDPVRLERVLRSGAVGVVRRDAAPFDLAAQVAALLHAVREVPEPA